jgi:uncharacterized protein (TIGR00369 family)
MQTLPHTRSCFVCGEANPIGLKQIMETDGQKVFARWSPEPAHVGFHETVHGGLISTLLDELMVWACAVRTRRFAYCAELTVRFQRPLRPGRTVQASAELTANRRDKVFETSAEMRDESGAVLATATGKYIPLKPERVREMLGDVVGPLGNFLDLD